MNNAVQQGSALFVARASPGRSDPLPVRGNETRTYGLLRIATIRVFHWGYLPQTKYLFPNLFQLLCSLELSLQASIALPGLEGDVRQRNCCS